MKSNLFAVFVVSASALALAACSGGGGGNGISGGGPVVTPPAPPVTVNITGVTALGPAGNNPLEATGPTPNFTTSNNLPPNGTVFPLNQGAITITSSSATGTYAGAGYATIQGTVTTGGVLYPLLDLKVPALGINVTGLRGDGTAKTQADGASVSAAVASLNYTLLGSWSYKRTGNNGTVLGLVVSGYQTPAGSVPATGTASYVGIGGLNSGATAGGVVGSVAVPGSNGSINAATLSGDVNLNVNFATRQANGTLSNMVAKDVITGTTSPWNNVTLSGNLSHAEWDTANPGAVITGTTHAQSAPLGATFGMSSTATGNLNAALYGPNASEVGALWSVNEGSGATGKTAFGFFGATKQ
jgi:hypothetical protein